MIRNTALYDGKNLGWITYLSPQGWGTSGYLVSQTLPVSTPWNWYILTVYSMDVPNLSTGLCEHTEDTESLVDHHTSHRILSGVASLVKM